MQANEPNSVERDRQKATLFMACGKLHTLGSGHEKGRPAPHLYISPTGEF